MKKLISGGNAVFTDRIEKCDILIDGEKIAAIYKENEYKNTGDCEVIDAKGLYVMPGTIDPHMHMGLYKPYGEAMKRDTPRQAVGGVTTIINYHRGKGNYFETVQRDIDEGEANSTVDFAISLGLCAKKHLFELEDYVNKLGITSFKFFFDKQDIAHIFYGIPKEEALTLDKADLYRILVKLKEISPELLLSVHCEDPDMFRFFEKEVRKTEESSRSLAVFGKTRPSIVETECVGGSLWINAAVGGNMYIVHTSAASSIEMYRSVTEKFGGKAVLETCPHYLLLDENSPCGLLGKVNPPLRTKKDAEAMWQGISDGTVKTIGTDNVPVDLSKKYERGEGVFDVYVGFGGAGIILPTLISEGYHKRGIPLTVLSMVNSTNAARIFGLKEKGEIKEGFDADFAIVDLEWERTITPDLYGDSDFSVYDGMTFKGWPVYTIRRGEIIAKDGKPCAMGGGKYIRRGGCKKSPDRKKENNYSNNKSTSYFINKK